MHRIWGLLLCVFATWALGCGGDQPPKTPADSPFERTEVKGLGDPEVVIENHAGRPIRVTVDGPTKAVLELPAGTTKSAKVKPGIYKYRAEARGAVPFDGMQGFDPDGRYTWSFVITSKYPPPPAAMKTQLEGLLRNGFTTSTTIGGLRLGDSKAKLPPGMKDEGGGVMAHPQGWAVVVEKGKVAAFRYQQNFASALGLYEESDVIARFGEPNERMKPASAPDATILLYEAKRVGVLISKNKHVVGFLFL